MPEHRLPQSEYKQIRWEADVYRIYGDMWFMRGCLEDLWRRVLEAEVPASVVSLFGAQGRFLFDGRL